MWKEQRAALLEALATLVAGSNPANESQGDNLALVGGPLWPSISHTHLLPVAGGGPRLRVPCTAEPRRNAGYSASRGKT